MGTSKRLRSELPAPFAFDARYVQGYGAVGLVLGGAFPSLPVVIPSGRFEFPGNIQSAILEPTRVQGGITFGPGFDLEGGNVLANFPSNLIHRGRVVGDRPATAIP